MPNINILNRAAAEQLRQDRPNLRRFNPLSLQESSADAVLKVISLSSNHCRSDQLQGTSKKELLPLVVSPIIVSRIPDFAAKEIGSINQPDFFYIQHPNRFREIRMRNAVDMFNKLAKVFTLVTNKQRVREFIQASKEKFDCAIVVDSSYSLRLRARNYFYLGYSSLPDGCPTLTLQFSDLGSEATIEQSNSFMNLLCSFHHEGLISRP